MGIEPHLPSVEAARRRAVEAGVDDRLSFVEGLVEDFEGGPYDVVWFFDVIHDLGDPTKAAAYVLTQPSEGGTLALVEPSPSTIRSRVSRPTRSACFTTPPRPSSVCRTA